MITSKVKIYLLAGVAVYLTVLAVISSTLYGRYAENDSFPIVEQVYTEKNDSGFEGLLLKGSGLSSNTLMFMIPDTIDNPSLLSESFDNEFMFDVVVCGDYLYAAKGRQGVAILERKPGARFKTLKQINLQGQVVDLAVVDSSVYALLKSPGRLVELKRADLGVTAVGDTVVFGGKPVSLHAVTDGLFVADHSQGLWKISYDLKHIVDPSHFKGVDSCWRLASDSRQLFAVSSAGKFWRLPFGDSAVPILVREFSTRIRGLVADDRSVTVQTETGDLCVYVCDKSNKLTLLQELSMGRNKSSGLALVQDGNILIDLSPSTGLQVLKRDVEGQLSLPGSSLLQAGMFLSIDESDGVLYTASTRGLSAWDLDALTSTSKRGYSHILDGAATRAAIWRNYLVTLHSKDLSVANLLSPGLPTLRHDLRVRPLDMALGGDHLWVAQEDRPVAGFHITPDGEILPCAEIEGTHGVNRLAIEGNKLVVSSGQSLKVISVEDPCHPRSVEQVSLESVLSDIVLDGDYVFTTSKAGKELIFFRGVQSGACQAVARYRLPTHLSEFSQPGYIIKVGSILYVSLGQAGLLALDVTTPERPKEVFYVDTPGASNALREHEGMLYVANKDFGIWILDLQSTKETGVPRVVGNLRTVLDVQDMLFDRGRMFLVGAPKGVVMMDEPHVFSAESASGNAAFIPLPANFATGRYRAQVYNHAGHLSEDLVVNISKF